MSGIESLRKGEQLPLQRSVEAISIPFGKPVTLDEDDTIQIMQALGTSVSVLKGGNMYLIEGYNLDAFGIEPTARPWLAGGASDEALEAFAWQQLRTCFDPEIPVDIVELGLVYGCRVTTLIDGQKMVQIRMTLTAPGCGMGDVIAEDAKNKILGAEQISRVNIELVFDPPWSREMMSDEAKLALNMF
ncbi:putative Fe-S cluster assembly protein SufT [Kushneria aurantia]|uniref:Fe-S cluster assembly protein SufT n=1 Tax=Kushneria aurantia TaxID=504092 RepID=A0ABV6G997_9GAMM|nr:putative Fe-S cluster assembly protein SufT [Kushneria aurantia]